MSHNTAADLGLHPVVPRRTVKTEFSLDYKPLLRGTLCHSNCLTGGAPVRRTFDDATRIPVCRPMHVACHSSDTPTPASVGRTSVPKRKLLTCVGVRHRRAPASFRNYVGVVDLCAERDFTN